MSQCSPVRGSFSSLGSKGSNQGQFNGLYGIAVDSGVLYVSDNGNSRVQLF